MPASPGSPSTPRPVVSNTTPLIVLAGLDLLGTLRILYGEIWIPDVVRDEYVQGSKPSEPDIAALSWLRVQPSAHDSRIIAKLDAGEAAAIGIALANSARLILLDEERARKEARRLGLSVARSLAVLLEAKAQGIIPLVKPLVDQLTCSPRLKAGDSPAREGDLPASRSRASPRVFLALHRLTPRAPRPRPPWFWVAQTHSWADGQTRKGVGHSSPCLKAGVS